MKGIIKKFEALPLTQQLLIGGGVTLGVLFIANRVKGRLSGSGAYGGFLNTTIQQDPFTAGNIQGENATNLQIRNLIDQIVKSTNENWGGYYYPEVVNRLANLNAADLQAAYNYYNAKYRSPIGASLYNLIADEWAYNWDFSHMYQPALDILTRYNMTT